MKKIFSIVMVLVILLSVPVSALAAGGGFDQYGYNDTGRIFNGTGSSWCVAGGGTETSCAVSMAPYANDQLVMKWSDDWDRGNTEGWTGVYDKAWTSNEWNGAFPGGSGEVWHYKIIWVGSQLEDGPYWRDGGYAIWGQFEVIMDQGMSDGAHYWLAHGTPSGYGGR